MYTSPADTLQEYLHLHQITPEKFAEISGMPVREVHGLLEGRLTFTALRANHLAAAFNTKTEVWLEDKSSRQLETSSLS